MLNLDFNFDAKTRLKNWWTQVKNNFNAIEAWANNIENRGVTSAHLASGSVTTVKIADGNVTADKLGANSVTTVKIENSAVTADKLASNAVTTTKIASNAVTVGKIASDAVSTNKISDGAVTRAKLASEVTTELDNKTAKGHAHAISDINGLQTALDSKKNTTYTLTKSGSTIKLTGSDGSSTSVTDSDTTYSTATQSSSGLMSAEDKKKLDGLTQSASGEGVIRKDIATTLISNFAKINRNEFGEDGMKGTYIDCTVEDGTLIILYDDGITDGRIIYFQEYDDECYWYDSVQTDSGRYRVASMNGNERGIEGGETVLYFSQSDMKAYVLWNGNE